MAAIVLIGMWRRGEGAAGRKAERPEARLQSAHGENRESVESEPETEERTIPSHLPAIDEVVLPPLADIVAQHGSPPLTAEEDLEIVSQAIQFQLRVTGALPESAPENSEITSWLAGLNAPRIAVLAPDHESIDREGRLVDRWKTPYRFVLDDGEFEAAVLRIESAGPDSSWGNGDDLTIEMPLAEA